MDLSQFFSVDILATMAGMVAFVMILTEITKHFVKGTAVEKFDTRWYGLFWSIVANVAALVFLTHDYSAQGIFTCFINILLVTVAASGTFDVGKTVKVNGEVKKEEGNGE